MRNKPTCGTARNGETCERAPDHLGVHCSIPELGDLSEEAFARATCRMLIDMQMELDGRVVAFACEVKDA